MASSETEQYRQIAPAEGGRLVIYGISFAGLMATLFGLTGLIGLVLTETVFRSRSLLSASDARDQITYYLAALIVAVPVWLWFWQCGRLRVEREAQERDAVERRLFFALTFAIGAGVSLIAGHMLLRVLFTLPAPHDTNGALRDSISSLVRLVVYGGAGYVYTRMAWRERPATEQDGPRDLALQVIAGLSLVFLSIGLIDALGAIIAQLVTGNRHVLLGSTPDSTAAMWAEIAAWIVSGGAAWAAVTYRESIFPGVREFRVAYLYAVLAVSGSLTLAFGGNTLYELLRRAFGYRPDPMWSFLSDSAPMLLTAGALWAYHWTVLRRQARLEPSRSAGAVVAWPRRPYFAALSLVGLTLTAVGAVELLWTLADFVFKRASLSGDGWWRDSASSGIALLVAGTLAWLRPWVILQAAAASSERERGADSRRRLLGAVVLVAALAGVGFAIAGLWLILRTLLGGPHDASTYSDLFRYAGSALVAAGIAIYHALIFREDMRTGAARIRIASLVAPNRRDFAAELSRSIGRPIEVIGYLAAGEPEHAINAQAVEERIAALAAAGVPRVLLILHADGTEVVPYSKNLRMATQAAGAEAELHSGATAS